VQALASWFGQALDVLTTSNLESAVALGAATYARLRAGVGPAMPMVKAGSGRAYYVGLRAALSDDRTPAVCVIARGTAEGTEIHLDHPFTVTTNRPISFSLYSSTIRSDGAGDITSLQPGDDAREHAPLVTVLRYGRKSRQVELPVRLSVAFTEVGILELWCRSQLSDHLWRLHFQVRGEPDDEEDGDASETDAASGARPSGDAGPPSPPSDAVVPDELVVAAERAIRSVFEAADGGITAETLVALVEQTIGFGKTAWPLAVLRRKTRGGSVKRGRFTRPVSRFPPRSRIEPSGSCSGSASPEVSPPRNSASSRNV
jgi:hypothetical protein